MGLGADVVLQLVGGTGIGILQITADAGKLGIVSDANQNGLHSELVLTSMVKHVDVAVFEVFAAARDGDWKPGILSLGLAEDGVDWTLDD
ncbi:BMP family ABC transporter substrate-binding protein [Thalassospira xiamenensis]|uniref:BMP family ABC transporter substrate-binding protein n=1 Tax=Thalassospira xiamenensis TaxID=220697 RepID=UPI001F4574E7|nr:BMP family ABC transporter substrate-binding protein [Thalassospira xiamenensis]